MTPEASSSWVRKFAPARHEAARIVLGELRERVRRGIVLPDLAEVGVVADVFAKNDLAVSIDSDVVKHLLALGAVEQQLDGAAAAGLLASVKSTAHSRLGKSKPSVVTK